MGRRLCPWVTVRRHSRRTCRTNAYICMREQTLQSTLYPHACVTCGFATPLTPLPALQATLTRTETPHRMVSKVAAEETTVTMEMGEPICAPAYVGRQQRAALRSTDSGCVSVLVSLMCTETAKSTSSTMRQKYCPCGGAPRNHVRHARPEFSSQSAWWPRR